MISRIWHGWTTPANADAYEHLLREEIFAGITGRRIAGFLGIDLLRRPADTTVEFVTIMWFESLEAVRAFAGADYEVAVVPVEARKLLQRFDARSAHYDVRGRRTAATGRCTHIAIALARDHLRRYSEARHPREPIGKAIPAPGRPKT